MSWKVSRVKWVERYNELDELKGIRSWMSWKVSRVRWVERYKELDELKGIKS